MEKTLKHKHPQMILIVFVSVVTEQMCEDLVCARHRFTHGITVILL